jgi:hypothetical protein
LGRSGHFLWVVEQLVAFLFCKDCIPKRGLSKKIEIEKSMLKNSWFLVFCVGLFCYFYCMLVQKLSFYSLNTIVFSAKKDSF